MSQPGSSRVWAIPSLLFGATMWGLIWYPYRLLQDAGAGGVATSLITYLIPLVLAVAFTWRHLKTARGHVGWLVLLALAAGWTNMAYVLAVIEGEVMRVVLLFYLAPVWTVFFARAMLGERLTLWGWLVMLFSFTGALVMLWPADGGLPIPANRAEWIALSAGVSFALANVVTRKVDAADTWAKALSVWAGVCVVAGFAAILVTEPFAFLATASPLTYGILLGVGLCIGAMTLAVQYGLSHTLANQAILIFLFELVAAALSSWWWADEMLTTREWLGAAMIVTGSLFSGQLEKATQPERGASITGLFHAGLLISDLAASRAFYESVLCMTPMPRPDLPYPGVWYALNAHQQLHLMQLPNPDLHATRPEHGGRDRHIALGVGNIEMLRARLDAARIAYTVSRSGRQALFCRDPDGNTLEFIETQNTFCIKHV